MGKVVHWVATRIKKTLRRFTHREEAESGDEERATAISSNSGVGKPYRGGHMQYSKQ
jgi:phosphatidylethanolamine-binding protein (PEBP) family uncharacterized protein